MSARDAFVHHEGGRTFRASDVDFASLLRDNQVKFRAKWAALAPGLDAGGWVALAGRTLADSPCLGQTSSRET